jgi:hypothetical protein
MRVLTSRARPHSRQMRVCRPMPPRAESAASRKAQSLARSRDDVRAALGAVTRTTARTPVAARNASRYYRER